MNTYYVYINEDDYVESWSKYFNEDFTEIQADSSLFEKIGCVKVIDGVGVLDEAKEKEIDFNNKIPSDKEIIMEAISDLAENQSVQSDGLTEIAEIVSELMEGSESNG